MARADIEASAGTSMQQARNEFAQETTRDPLRSPEMEDLADVPLSALALPFLHAGCLLAWRGPRWSCHRLSGNAEEQIQSKPKGRATSNQHSGPQPSMSKVFIIKKRSSKEQTFFLSQACKDSI